MKGKVVETNAVPYRKKSAVCLEEKYEEGKTIFYHSIWSFGFGSATYIAGYANLSNVYYKKKFVNWHVKFRRDRI